MNTHKRPSSPWLLIVFIGWLVTSTWAWNQTTAPAPERDWQFGDLLTPWRPIGINTALGRTPKPSAKGTSVQLVEAAAESDGDKTRSDILAGKRYTLMPSPLALLTNVFFLTFLYQAFKQQVYWSRGQAKVQGVIKDAPIEDLQSDRLQRAPLVRALAALFRNQDTEPPLTVALTAPWGVGKSSILKMLKTELQGHARCIYINPWHYPKDSQLLGALMTGICQDAVPPMLSLANVRFRGNLLWHRVLVPQWRWLLALAGVSVFVFWPDNSELTKAVFDLFKDTRWQTMLQSLAQTGANVQAKLPSTLQAWVATWLGHGTQTIAIWLGLLLLGHSFLKSLYTFSPSLTRALAESAQWVAKGMSLADWSQHAGLRHQFAKDLREISQAFDTQRLVLLIDDLDRCEPHQVAQTLATLNFVFTNQASCFVVLAMDKHYVEHALGLAYKDMALALRDGQVPAEGDPEKSKIKDNEACLNFARQYVRKLVQLEVSLTHDKEQGAWMVLERSKEKTKPPTNFSNWLCARWRYHTGRREAIKVPMSDVIAAEKWPSWPERLLRWIKKELNAILDLRVHHLSMLANLVFVGASSYLLALLLTVLVGVLAPSFVPESVPDTTTKEDANNVKRSSNTATASAGLQTDTLSTKASASAVEQNNRAEVGAHQPETSQFTGQLMLLNIIFPFICLLWIAFQASQLKQDSEGFLDAVRHWQPVLNPRFPNPREWKRLCNMARFLAMRVRADQFKTRSERLAAWWQVQLKWANAVLTTLKGSSLPSPGSLEEVKPFTLSEGAAVELWMLDCLLAGKLRIALEKYVTGLPIHNDLMEKFIEAATSAMDLEPMKKRFPYAVLIENSPNLSEVFKASGDDYAKTTSMVKQWLAWTQDLRMDLSEEAESA